jgi:4-hydroxy-tetrahydrodipicolinate synthase
METIGCGTAIVTPFRADGSVDEPALWALVNWQIESGIDFIVACGSTGEAATLDEEEWLHTIRVVIEAAAGRVPVWAGCTHNSTRTLVQQAGRLKRMNGLSALPVCLYNVPGRTAANLEPETVARLVSAAKNIEAIKEAGGKLTQFAELAHILPRGFKIFSGDDNLALAAIGVGAHGLISVASNEAPKEVTRMVRDALSNNWAEARSLERRLAQLFEANFWESNPGPVKTVLSMMGWCSDHMRLPLVPPGPATRARLERMAGELDLLKHAPLPADYRPEVF